MDVSIPCCSIFSLKKPDKPLYMFSIFRNKTTKHMKLGEDTDRIVNSWFKRSMDPTEVKFPAIGAWKWMLPYLVILFSHSKKAGKPFYWFNIFKNITPTLMKVGEDTDRVVPSRFKWLNGSNRCHISNYWCLNMAKNAIFQTREPQSFKCLCVVASLLPT